jgi:hypothetical protein
MLLRGLAFVVVAILTYLGTVALAFVYWDVTGASGPDYTPLLFVLFILAPAVAILCGILVLRPRPPADPSGKPPLPHESRSAPVKPPVAKPATRHTRSHIVIAIVGAVLIVGVMVLLGGSPGHFVPRGLGR